MNYGGNMPDWHQFNTSQTNEIASAAQNVNSGHLTFIPGVSPSSYNAIGLSTEGLDKHQNGSNYNPRHYQSLNNVSSGPSIPNNSPLTSMMQMQSCIGHYGSPTARNPMLDNLNPSMDPRNTGIGGINDDLGYRTNQVPFNGPVTHLSGPNCNVNGPPGSGPVPASAPVPVPGSVPGPGSGSGPGSVVGPAIGPGHGVTPGSAPGTGPGLTHDPGTGSMGPRSANVGSMPPGRPGPPSFIPCKGLCRDSKQRDRDDRPKLCRSNSTSNLSPVKQKQRRLSDFDYVGKVDSREVVDSAYDTKVLFSDSAKANTSSHAKINRDSDKNFRGDLDELPDVDCAPPKLTDSRNEGKCSDLKRRHRTESFLRTGTFRDEVDNETQYRGSYNDPIIKAKSKMPSTELLHSGIVLGEKNDTVTVKTEYESSDDNESEFIIEDKHSKSDAVLQSQIFDNIDTSVITVDSSDESQTTIEILPASPDDSQSEMQVRGDAFRTIKNEPLYLEDAIPTQLELELEVIDNNNSGAFMSKVNEFSPASPNFVRAEKYEHISKSYGKSQSSDFKHPSNHRSRDEKFTFSKDKHLQRDQSSNKSNTMTNVKESTKKETKESSRSSTNSSKAMKQRASVVDKYFYCNDLLVKEVLAAKEALKKCLGQSESEIAVQNKSRPKTAAEKKQGSGFDFKDLKRPNGKSSAKSGDSNDKPRIEKKHRVVEKHSKVDKRETRRSVDESATSTCTYASTEDLVTISLKASKQLARITANETTISPIAHVAVPDGSNKKSASGAEKIRKDVKLEHEAAKMKSTENSRSDGRKQNSGNSVKETKTKEDNMPVLEPEVTLNFDSSSDRDSSRSPPVITNQDVVDGPIGDAKDVESKLITPISKAEDNKNAYKDCEMSIADIVTQLAYHEKATIKHRRYCNLCERWFPTTSRHRRHLAGYQHRHTELMQRKSIHTLFILFTGKPCPKLLPANTVRNDCSIGELTPLQIAVQDVAKCAEHVKTNLKTKD